MRVVIDTSVAVSALLLPQSTPRKAFDLALRSGKILISEATLAELTEVLHRPRFDRYLTEEIRLEFLAAVVRQAELVEVAERIAVCRDPKDDKFLELAVSGAADFLVTGDRDLLVLHPFSRTSILRPQDFYERFCNG